MRSNAGRLLVLLAGLAVGAGSLHVYAQADAKTRLSIWDGVYLEEQASRGKGQYDYNCASCHIHDLAGDSVADVPPLAGDDFFTTWNDKSVKELLDYMKTNMPADSKGSLDEQTYNDIAAYIMQSNKLPAGKEALGSNLERLGRTIIEKERKN